MFSFFNKRKQIDRNSNRKHNEMFLDNLPISDLQLCVLNHPYHVLIKKKWYTRKVIQGKAYTWHPFINGPKLTYVKLGQPRDWV